MYDTIIIGGGAAGITAAIYCKRYGLKTLLISEDIGGLLNEAAEIRNYPGFKKISGLDLVEKFKEHLDSYKIEMNLEEVKDIKKGFIVKTNKNNYESKTLIITSGSKKKKLNVKNEDKFSGKGVHYCAICDGYFYKNKIVGVVGGHNSAAQSALLLSKIAKKVYIIYRKEKIRAEKFYLDEIEKNKKIVFINNSNVKEIIGDKFLEKVLLDTNKEIKLDGLFIDIGYEPSVELIKNLRLKLDKNNNIVVNNKMETDVKGVFAAGDVTNTILRQISTAVGDGTRAAFSAYEFLK